MVDIKKINEHIQGIYEAINVICANIPEKNVYNKEAQQKGIRGPILYHVNMHGVYNELRVIKTYLANIEALLK